VWVLTGVVLSDLGSSVVVVEHVGGQWLLEGVGVLLCFLLLVFLVHLLGILFDGLLNDGRLLGDGGMAVLQLLGSGVWKAQRLV